MMRFFRTEDAETTPGLQEIIYDMAGRFLPMSDLRMIVEAMETAETETRASQLGSKKWNDRLGTVKVDKVSDTNQLFHDSPESLMPIPEKFTPAYFKTIGQAVPAVTELETDLAPINSTDESSLPEDIFSQDDQTAKRIASERSVEAAYGISGYDDSNFTMAA